MSENLEVFREVWSMHLSATRNRIIRINLGVTVASFALTRLHRAGILLWHEPAQRPRSARAPFNQALCFLATHEAT